MKDLDSKPQILTGNLPGCVDFLLAAKARGAKISVIFKPYANSEESTMLNSENVTSDSAFQSVYGMSQSELRLRLAQEQLIEVRNEKAKLERRETALQQQIAAETVNITRAEVERGKLKNLTPRFKMPSLSQTKA